MDNLAIGIDLGTTNSCVALYIDGKVKILENSEGGRITPSFIFFTNMDGTLVGEHAKRSANIKPEFGIYEIKRLVGRQFDDPAVQNNLQYIPFKVESDDRNDPIVLIEQPNKRVVKTPQELCTIILEKIKRDVEAKMGQPVNKLVVTVPAYFNMRQREVTLAAAKAAGFRVLKLLNEPTAAALSYYYENKNNETNHSLVYDLGGGTFDVAILRRKLNNIEILSVDGDTHLGGHDFDNLIVDYVCEELKKNYDFDPKLNKVNLRRLRNKCEDAKKALSTTKDAIIIINGVVPGHPSVQITLTRTKFEEMADGLFKETVKIVDNCMKSSGVSKTSIKEVILAGGSTRILKIQQMVSEYFDGKILNKFVHPDECVAEGAALQAAMLSNSHQQNIIEIQMIDVVPLSLGLSDWVDEMSFMIKKNTPIPTSASLTHVNAYDQQTGLLLKIYEGERSDVRKNRFLGEMSIYNVTPAPPGQCKVTATLTIDQNGILTLKAKEKYRDNVKQLQIDYTRGDRNENEIKNAVRDLEHNRKEDERFKKFAQAKNYLLSYCVELIYNLEKQNLTACYKEIYELCKTMKNVAEKFDTEDEERLLQITKEVKQHCESIVQVHNFTLMPTI